MRRKTLVLHHTDNVANSLVDLEAGEKVEISIPNRDPCEIVLRQAVPLGHKFALVQIERGGQVIKSGLPIGAATENISPGEHVHTHNLA